MRKQGITSTLGAALCLGCGGPSLDVPRGVVASLGVELEPATPQDAAAPLSFRARLAGAPVGGEPWLFRGQLSDYYARSLVRGEVPSVLRKRAVPLRFWRSGADCLAQPLVWLEPEASYSLAYTGLGVVRELQTTAAGAPHSRRVFPPSGSDKLGAAVVCDVVDEPAASALVLEPGSVAVEVTPGVAGQPAAGCFTLRAEAAPSEAVVAPPLFGGALLEPSAWLPAPSPDAEEPPASCGSGELPGACLEVLDDRLRVTPNRQDSLFVLEAPGAEPVAARVGKSTLLLRGLLPNSEQPLRGAVLTSAGTIERFDTRVTTASPRRHVVLNEVLANPLGPEPASEWLELLNDSPQPVSLSGLWLEDSGGHVELPDVRLEANEIALLVSDDFHASALDVAIPTEVRQVRVPSLGARGLANGGEALLLVGREGVVSRFPLLPAPHAGRSIARRSPDSADDDPAAFAEHGGPGASPGTPNTFDD
jgi:hypothetical protein